MSKRKRNVLDLLEEGLTKEVDEKKAVSLFLFAGLAYMAVYGAFLLSLVAGAFWLWKAFFGA